MINVLVIVMEAITMWLCLHIAFGEKIKRTKGEALFFVVYIPVFIFCSFGVFIEVLYFLLWVFIAVWCKILFDRKLLNTVVRAIVGIVMVGVLEIVVMYVYTFLFDSVNISMRIECILIGTSLIVLSYVIYNKFVDKRKRHAKNVFDVNIFVIVLLISLFLFYVKLEFEINRKMPVAYVFFFVLLSITFVVLCNKQKAVYELEKKNLNLELQSIYGTAYNDLLQEVRRRQHDYRNQLTAVFSMHNTVNSLEELKSMQERYIGIVEADSDFDFVLTRCKNPIIAGYLYTINNKLKKDNIVLKTDVHINDDNIDVRTKDIVEILGILLTNAKEYLKDNVELDGCIYLNIYKKNDAISIEVKNTSRYIPYDMLSKMFDAGYSTKSSERGIGLTSLRCIIKKYSGELRVDNAEIEGENFLRFRINI